MKQTIDDNNLIGTTGLTMYAIEQDLDIPLGIEGRNNKGNLRHRPVLLLPNMAPKVPVKHLQSMRKQRFRT